MACRFLGRLIIGIGKGFGLGDMTGVASCQMQQFVDLAVQSLFDLFNLFAFSFFSSRLSGLDIQ